jgi:site-specific DNA-adenine methylase
MKMPKKIKNNWIGGSAENHIKCLQERLKNALGFIGDWKRVLKSKTQTTKRGITGVFLDPPYRGTEDYYSFTSEDKPERTSIADEVDTWALEKGYEEKFRIAVCGYLDNFQIPEYKKADWKVYTYKGPIGHRSGKKEQTEREDADEVIAFSPHCLEVKHLPDKVSLI